MTGIPLSGSPSTAYVDLEAITANVRALRVAAPTAEAMVVVKADGYGHGLVPAARAAVRGGATWLGTAQLAEALALRDSGIGGRVLTWLHVPGVDFAAALTRDIDVTVSARWSLDAVVRAARQTGHIARVHLKVDTGLARNGAYGNDFTDLVQAALHAQADGSIEVVGIWSHFACADEPGHPSVVRQQRVFEAAVAEAAAAGCRFEVRHLANSAATLTNPSTHYDLVRLGIAAYGYSPVHGVADPAAYGLVPAMTLVARLAQVKRVPAGQGVSYGHLYTTREDTVLGLVPVGYADGIPRNASGVGPLGVGGRRYTIAGRVCMDQLVVDLGPTSAVRAGDEVVLFGPDPARGPSAQDWADATGTISYEIVTRIGTRVPRVYVGAPEEPS
jgi:alanine racemase